MPLSNPDIPNAVVQTQRGKALCTAFHIVDIPWHDAFGRPPFTVEIWTLPKLCKEWLVTCVNLPERSQPDWGVTVGSQGELAVMISGERPRWVWTNPPFSIVDGQWHHLGVAFDGKGVALYIDGKLCSQESAASDPFDMCHSPGLQIGSQAMIECGALISEVKLSRGLQSPVVDHPLCSDDRTIALWRLGNAEEVSDVTGHCPSGVVKTFPRESLDTREAREYRAGPDPLAIPGQTIQLHEGDLDHASGPAVLSLDGQWQMVASGDDVSRLTEPWSDAIHAQIPGSVHSALEEAGKIPDPKFGLNEIVAGENSFKTWWFRKKFPRPRGTGHKLIFDGVAICCTVWLNGVKLGEHEGMFGGPYYDVSQLLRDENDLIVKIEPAPLGAPPPNRTENTGWKTTVVFNNVYGWHYCHIPALGIWRNVRVESSPTLKLLNPFVVTHNAQSGDISLRLDLEGEPDGWQGKLVGTIAAENFSGPTLHFSHEVSSDTKRRSLRLRLRIPDPRPWWPNGLGKPNLYRLKLSALPKAGGQGDFYSTTFGLRTISMAPSPAGEWRILYNWTFVINNRPTFLKGTGWCTMDSSMDFSRQRYERFLRAALEQNCQMVRCWGNGMPETDDFYDLCDRLGLTVMQEWPTAGNSHNQQPFDALEETVRVNMLRLRNHPSLIMWCGGNESSKPYGKSIDMMGRYAIELDGTRPFHRSEPWGGSDHNYDCWWGKAHLDYNVKMTSRFFGEFGIASMPVYESVQRYLPPEEKALWPPDENGAFAHHTPVFNKMQDMDRLRQYAGYFTAADSMQRFIIGSQLAQTVAVRHPLERARARWPECAGALMYKLNDNYPAASWSTVDWYGAAKISHWFVQDAFAPLHACVLLDTVNNHGKPLNAAVILLDDADVLSGAKWSVCVRAYDGQLRQIDRVEFSGEGAIQRVRHLGDLRLTEGQTAAIPLLIVAEVLRQGRTVDRTFYFVNYEQKKDSLFELPATSLSLSVESGRALLHNTGIYPAVGAAVLRPGHADTFSADDNYFWLDPGETKSIVVSDVTGLVADAWNLHGRTW